MDAFNNDRYIFSSVYSEESIIEVIKLQEEEQLRRVNDVSGESQRRLIAHNVSELFSENVRTNWFSQGSAFLFDLLQNARSKAVTLKSSASIKTYEAVGDVKTKLDEVKLKVGDTSKKGVRLSSELTSLVSQKSKETAQDIKASAQQTQVKGLEKASEVQDIIMEKLGSAQTAIQEVAQQSVKKVQGAALRFTSSSRSLWGRLNKSFTKKTNLAFLLVEEETERAYRMNSETQSYAILNALAVSSLIKDLGYEFYRPTSEPNRVYATRLLEHWEQQRRMVNDLSDQVGVKNAKAVAELVDHKWKGTTPTPAAMVAAKAEVIAEIKQVKMVGAAM